MYRFRTDLWSLEGCKQCFNHRQSQYGQNRRNCKYAYAQRIFYVTFFSFFIAVRFSGQPTNLVSTAFTGSTASCNNVPRLQTDDRVWREMLFKEIHSAVSCAERSPATRRLAVVVDDAASAASAISTSQPPPPLPPPSRRSPARHLGDAAPDGGGGLVARASRYVVRR